MSSISSISSQPPVAPPPPVKADADKEQAKAAADKVDDLTATANKAQAVKAAGTGTVLDIQA